MLFDERNIPAIARIPALATDEVASVPPLHGVLATLAHSVGHITSTIRPPGVVVSVVVANGVGGDGALLDLDGGVGITLLDVEGSSNHSGGSGKSEDQGLKGNHIVGLISCSSEVMISSEGASSTFIDNFVHEDTAKFQRPSPRRESQAGSPVPWR